MKDWPDILEFLAKMIRETKEMENYYREERDRLETENALLRKQLEVKIHAENALETAR